MPASSPSVCSVSATSPSQGSWAFIERESAAPMNNMAIREAEEKVMIVVFSRKVGPAAPRRHDRRLGFSQDIPKTGHQPYPSFKPRWTFSSPRQLWFQRALQPSLKGTKNPDFPVGLESRYADLNRRPTHYECVALPAELYRQSVGKNTQDLGLRLRFGAGKF